MPVQNLEEFSGVQTGQAPPVAPLRRVREYYNRTTDRLMRSVNNRAYVPVNIHTIAHYYYGVPANSGVVLQYKTPVAFLMPADFAGSKFVAGVAATAEAIFSVKKNGTEIGTLTFAISGTVPTLVAASAVSFAAGDILTVVGPADNDASLANLSMAFLAAL